MSKTKLTLKAYTELRRRLNNSCCEICPSNMLYSPAQLCCNKDKTYERFCPVCINEFGPIFIETANPRRCPCYNEGYSKEIFLRLDDLISELTITLTKEYSA